MATKVTGGGIRRGKQNVNVSEWKRGKESKGEGSRIGGRAAASSEGMVPILWLKS